MIDSAAELNGLTSRLIGLRTSREVHSVEVLDEAVSLHLSMFDNALKEMALLPYALGAECVLNELNFFKERINTFREGYAQKRKEHPQCSSALDSFPFPLPFSLTGQDFLFVLYGREIGSLIEKINRNISDLDERKNHFLRLKSGVEQHIQLEVLPDEVLGDDYLAQGKLIVPTTIKSSGYHLYKINFQFCSPCSRPHGLNMELMTEYGLPSVEEVLQQYCTPRPLGTVAVAKNTENYPLEETVLPILKLKYLEGFNATIGN